MLFYSTAVQLVLLAATVTAFQPPSKHTSCAINRRHHQHASQTKPICTIIHAAAKGFAKNEEGEEEEELELEIPDDPELDNLLSVYARLNEVLSERREELLLLDASQLQKQCPLSTIEADNQLRSNSINITTEEKVREALLSSRLPLPFLNKSRLGPSLIEGAGRGLFATEDLTEGEVITCYPGDALMYEMPVDVEDENDDESNDDDHGEEDYVEEMVLWGVHVPEKNIWSEDVVFDGDEGSGTPPLTAYGVSIDDQYSVMGHPALDDNPAYFGHFVNDGAGHLALEKPNSESNIAAALELGLDTSGGYSSDDEDDDDDDDDDEIGVEENIAAYVLKSIEVANAMHRPLDEKESHTVTVATRDIKKGEEILVTYGPDYWAGYA